MPTRGGPGIATGVRTKVPKIDARCLRLGAHVVDGDCRGSAYVSEFLVGTGGTGCQGARKYAARGHGAPSARFRGRLPEEDPVGTAIEFGHRSASRRGVAWRFELAARAN